MFSPLHVYSCACLVPFTGGRTSCSAAAPRRGRGRGTSRVARSQLLPAVTSACAGRNYSCNAKHFGRAGATPWMDHHVLCIPSHVSLRALSSPNFAACFQHSCACLIPFSVGRTSCSAVAPRRGRGRGTSRVTRSQLLPAVTSACAGRERVLL